MYEYRSEGEEWCIYRSPALPMGVLLNVFACESVVEEDILEIAGVSVVAAMASGRFACAEKP